jgi:HD superfamily phosphodiesterase
MNLHITLETDLERKIVSENRWREGSSWGVPRSGHPEGQVLAHIVAVLANIDSLGLESGARAKLRVVALLHDTFKGEVNRRRPRVGTNHHATIARKFAEGFIDDPDILEILELHDEAYNSWRLGADKKEWGKAEARGKRLIERLGSRFGLYMAFYRADNAAGDKNPSQLTWFETLAGQPRSHGIASQTDPQ